MYVEMHGFTPWLAACELISVSAPVLTLGRLVSAQLKMVLCSSVADVGRCLLGTNCFLDFGPSPGQVLGSHRDSWMASLRDVSDLIHVRPLA